MLSPTSLLAIESAADDDAAPFGGALRDIVLGDLSGELDVWTDGNNATFTKGKMGDSWTRSFALAANNYDFPAGGVPVSVGEGAGMPFHDLRAFYTAIYASPAGQLISFWPATPGMSQTSLHSPSNGYAGLVNFFDPDNYFTVSALALSGDPFLLEEAKKIVTTTGDHIKMDGQVI